MRARVAKLSVGASQPRAGTLEPITHIEGRDCTAAPGGRPCEGPVRIRMPDSNFDAPFYRRFYVDPRTRVTTRSEMGRRATMVAALVKQRELPVRRILDAGCGLGWMRSALLRAFPDATYTGLEVSEHLCRSYGWTRASLACPLLRECRSLP